MSLESCFNNEMAILDEQFGSGVIDREEYDNAVRELEREFGSAHERY